MFTRRNDDSRSQRARGAAKERSDKRALGEVDPIEPGVVTSIHERRAGSARYVVAIDGRDVATVSAQAIADLALRVGKRVETGEALSLQEESGRVAVFDKAVELLAVRARSVRDLRIRLRRTGAALAKIDEVLERLVALGLLNDEEYARNLAHSRVVSGGVSKRRISQELQKRGVARDVADDAIDTTLEEVELDEMGSARAAASKRLRSLQSLDAATRRRRLYAYLARRGYETAVIARVLKDLGTGELLPDE